MKEWTPRPVSPANFRDIALTGEEGYVLSRIDGATTTTELSLISGLAPAQVQQILGRLVEVGAVDEAGAPVELLSDRSTGAEGGLLRQDRPAAADGQELARQPGRGGLERRTSPRRSATGTGRSGRALEEGGLEALDEAVLEPVGEGGLEALDEAALEPVEDVELWEEVQGAPDPRLEPLEEPFLELEHTKDSWRSGEAATGIPDRDVDAELMAEPVQAADEDLEPVSEAASSDTLDALNYRKLFETQLHPLPADQRAELALTAEDPALAAFCFDPDPAVIRSVLHNFSAGLQHARLIAAHHRHAGGLQLLGQHLEFLKDAQVQRLLLRNPQLPEAVFRTMMSSRRLLELFKASIDREVSERSRTSSRVLLRQRFGKAESEEKVGLIFATQGRVLPSLAGLSFDGKTISLLCGRTYNSTLLIQNLARFATTPAPVLVHLLRQMPVKRQASLKQLVLHHHNMPPDVKRRHS